MKYSLLFVALAVIVTSGTIRADDPPEGLVPLIRFYDTKRNQHSYAVEEKELAAWRAVPTVKEHLAIGDVSTVELPGTMRIWRGVRRKDLRHYYYTKAPGRAPDIDVDNENFKVYVWKKSGDGRIPVYGSTWIDGGDVFFDLDRDGVKKFADDTKKALNVERKSLGNTPIFYVYPPNQKPGTEAK